MSKNRANIETSNRPSVIGIDFGSSSVKIAAVEKGVVDIITNQANFRQTPSVVGYGAGQRLVGETGSVKIKSNHSNTIVAAQRFLGMGELSEKDSLFCPAVLRKRDGQLYFKVSCQGNQETLLPEQVTAAFLTKLENIIEQTNNLVSKNTVIAVPSYLSQHERQALLDSVAITNKDMKNKCPIQLVDESTAIGLDYGFYKRAEFEGKHKYVLFVDFGHSKLSVSLIQFGKKKMKVVFQKSLRNLGCRDLDAKMMQFYAKIFEEANKDLNITISQSKRATLKLLEAIERQRKILSGISEYDFSIQSLLEDHDISYNMKREQFESISASVFDQLRQFFKNIQKELDSKNLQYDSIELVGGGSRIPGFIKIVEEEMAIEPSRTLNSSQCIARGSALISAINSALFRVPDYEVESLVNYSIKCLISETGQSKNSSQEVTLINSGEVATCQKNVEFSISAETRKVEGFVQYEGLQKGINKQIVSFSFKIEPLAQQITKYQLSLVFDQNKMVSSVSVIEIGGKQAKLELDWHRNLKTEQLRQFQLREKELMLNDYKIIQSYEIRNQFEARLYATRSKIEQSLSDPAKKDYIAPQAIQAIAEYISAQENELQEGRQIDFQSVLKLLQEKSQVYFQAIETQRAKHEIVDKQMLSLDAKLDSIVQGRVIGMRVYPEEVGAVKQWIAEYFENAKRKPKFEGPEVTVEEIKQTREAILRKIKEFNEQQVEKERAASYKQQQQNQFPRHEYQQRQAYNQRQHPYSPFGQTSSSMFEEPHRGANTRRRGNQRNEGFFSNFSGFF